MKVSVEQLTPTEQKRANRRRIFLHIYEQRQTSKQQIASSLQLSLPTITQNLKELTEAALVEKNGFFHSELGRKAQIIQCCPNARIGIGVEVLKESVNIIAADLYGTKLRYNSMVIKYENEDTYFTHVSKWILSFIDALPYPKEHILGVGISIQGLVSLDGQTVTYGRIMNNTGLSLDVFSRHFPYPCSFLHDADVAAFAEIWFNREISDAIYLGLNNNIGSSMIVDGQVRHAKLSHSGNIEHMCLNPNGKTCYCGRKGCFETYCSGEYLEEQSAMSLEQFFVSLRNHNTRCEKIWQQYLENLAFVIDNIRFVINSPIILGGLVASYFIEEDYEIIHQHIQKNELNELFLIPGNCKKHNAALGAALWYIDEFIQNI